MGEEHLFPDLSVRPRTIAVYLGIGVGFVGALPLARRSEWFLVLSLLGLVGTGTYLYVRHGFPVVRERCPRCGGPLGLGAIWCPHHRGAQVRFTHPFLQLLLVALLTWVVGAAAGLSLSVLDWVRPLEGRLVDLVLGTGYGLFRTYFLIYALFAIIPVPFALALLVRGTLWMNHR